MILRACVPGKDDLLTYRLSTAACRTRYNLPSLLKAASEYFDVNINRCLLESVDILKYPMPQLLKILEDPKYQDVISPDVYLNFEHMDDDDDEEEPPVEGKPTTTTIVEYLRVILDHLLHVKISFQLETTYTEDVLPMVDDDDVDGVYATSSLVGAVTYTEEDAIDPEEVEDGEDIHVEGGQHTCKFCKFASTSAEELDKHRARQHNRNTGYVCQLCDYEATWSKTFYEHCREHWQPSVSSNVSNAISELAPEPNFGLTNECIAA
ncbi:zinc finger, C2H2 type [Ostertagia ostertagi]